ncbi:hypothetical protein LCGC14_1423190 [marine sediment metagenome]|uniref:Uncharacterized protein n=1 Tax=marine sediment metagenome TaxID=412755 RepID=A0A0F9JR81_9ZZZZ
MTDKEFWERCGLKHDWQKCYELCVRCSHCGLHAYKDCTSTKHVGDHPCSLPIDLNNLFKYAVPTTLIKLADIDHSTIMRAYYKLFDMWIKLMMEPPDTVGIEARSLYKVCYKALGGKE